MKLGLLIVIISLFLIVACTKTSITGETTIEETTVEEDPCFNVECEENQVCVDGSCVCEEEFRLCKGDCISEQQCCTDEECGKTEICEINECVFSCTKIMCEYNEVCDEDLKKCVCAPNTRYCEWQKRCLNYNKCCDNYDCEGTKKCTITRFSANVCFEGDGKKECKWIGENTIVYFILYDNRYDFKLERIYQDNQIKYSINGDVLKLLELGERVKLAPRLYLYLQEIREIGGLCEFR